MKNRLILSFLLLSFINIVTTGCRGRTYDYGLVSGKRVFSNSFYLTRSKLIINNEKAFEDAFKSNEFVLIKKAVDSYPNYLQAENIFLPIIQKIDNGDNFVFLFERTFESDGFINFEQIAFECKNLDNDVLSFPSNCSGYLLTDGSNWPPTINDIKDGIIKINNKEILAGYISGQIKITFQNDKVMQGEFSVFDKNKRLFLNTPARL
jgi:hypothetical protein